MKQIRASFLVLLACSCLSTLAKSRKRSKKNKETVIEQEITQEITSDNQSSSWSSLFVSKKTIKTMEQQELEEKLQFYLEKDDAFIALKYVDRLYALATDSDKIADLLVLKADLLFKREEYDKAAILYQEFARLYPNHAQTGRALAQAIDASFHCISTIDRDQTKTHSTIGLAKAFLQRSDAFPEQVPQVQEILDKSRKHLFEHELYIVDYYLKRDKTKAAQKRLEDARKQFNDSVIDSEPLLLIQECRLAWAKGDVEQAEQKSIVLAAQFPDYLNDEKTLAFPELKELFAIAPTVVAQSAQPEKQRKFVDRF